MTHTPGPYGKMIDGVWWTQIALDNLYAAAPELLRLLSAAYSTLLIADNSRAWKDERTKLADQIEAAIAQATGDKS